VSIAQRLGAALLAVTLLVAGGCDKVFPNARTPFHGVDVTGTGIGQELRLTDTAGHARSLADFRGKVVVVIFGYTQCPDVCPTTLATYAGVVKRLGGDGSDVQVVFVTVDPKRDTARLLGQYVTAFDPAFIALRGDAAATEKVVHDFRIVVEERPGKTPESYTVDHSSQVFVFDRAGQLRLMIPADSAAEPIAEDLRILLNS
jgi:protein SCO1